MLHGIVQQKKEPARHEMCKIKSTIIIVQGVGTKVVVTISELEKQGCNLTFECVLEGLLFFIEQTGIKKIRNIYVQLDNVSSNKCYTLAAAFASLILLGICKKVKVSYLEVWLGLLYVDPIINCDFVIQVGHSHEDVDAIIGNLVSYLRPRDIRTYEELVQAMKNALHGMKGKV